ncbi:HNH endonuclease [Yersinia massiliensis]|uniref:HNH endonuclease n=1 Tax=Yersinia massiliensis TaxID=419257 RepID=UPI000679381E|nr:HNH endonuclease [Yersinia massiliensis]MCB5320093.1 HNH endonuclease [Yersinia massiliensis]
MNELTQKHLHELFDYNPDTGIFTRKVFGCGIRAGNVVGTLNPKGYRQIRIHFKRYQAHRLAWFYVYGRWTSEMIDHINGVKDDNRIVNLREATNVENQQNQLMHKDNTSGVKGVYWDRHERKWRSRCWLGGKQRHVGIFTNLNEAELAVRQFREKNHGRFCNHG